MKHLKLLSVILLSLLFLNANAQRPAKSDDRIESFKIAFITKKVGLDL